MTMNWSMHVFGPDSQGRRRLEIREDGKFVRSVEVDTSGGAGRKIHDDMAAEVNLRNQGAIDAQEACALAAVHGANVTDENGQLIIRVGISDAVIVPFLRWGLFSRGAVLRAIGAK